MDHPEARQDQKRSQNENSNPKSNSADQKNAADATSSTNETNSTKEMNSTKTNPMDQSKNNYSHLFKDGYLSVQEIEEKYGNLTLEELDEKVYEECCYEHYYLSMPEINDVITSQKSN